jgi:hypothetical protein
MSQLENHIDLYVNNANKSRNVYNVPLLILSARRLIKVIENSIIARTIRIIRQNLHFLRDS